MVGLGTLVFAVTRTLWRSPRYWLCIGLAAAVALGLTAPFFLPYVQVQQDGFARTARGRARLQRQWRRVAGLVGLGAPLVAAADRGLLRGALSGRPGHDPRPGRRWCAALRRTAAGAAQPAAPALARDVVGFYALVAVVAFWASFGPDAGLYRLLYDTVPVFSFLRAPARIGIVVPLALVVLASAVLAPWLRARARPVAWTARARAARRARTERRAPHRFSRRPGRCLKRTGCWHACPAGP